MNQGQDILDVKEELQHVRSYLEIQQMRYQDILQYEICVPEELNHCQIPKITLQPLVENALYHGIKNKRGKGMIRIEGELDGAAGAGEERHPQPEGPGDRYLRPVQCERTYPSEFRRKLWYHHYQYLRGGHLCHGPASAALKK